MKIKRRLQAVLLSAVLSAPNLYAETVTIDMQLPAIQAGKYQRPFVAVWVEQKGQRQALKTLSIWYDDKKWLKDIRRWWRKAGRYDGDIDHVTGATKPPGRYQLIWDGTDSHGKTVSPGEYTLYLEAVREHGNRTLLKQPIIMGAGNKQTYTLNAGDELGPVNIVVGEDK